MAERILVVDDDPEFLKFVQTILERAGYLFCPATSGKTAMQWLSEPAKPRLIVLDIRLENDRLNGLEICQALKKDAATADIPVIILSSAADNESRIRGRGVEADLILSKPIKPQDLLKAIRSLLEAAGRGRDGVIRCGDLELDPERNLVKFRGKSSSRLSPALFDVFYVMARNFPNTLSRKYLMTALRHPAKDREIDVLISRLRRLLKQEFGSQFITTVTRQGYRIDIPLGRPERLP